MRIKNFIPILAVLFLFAASDLGTTEQTANSITESELEAAKKQIEERLKRQLNQIETGNRMKSECLEFEGGKKTKSERKIKDGGLKAEEVKCIDARFLVGCLGPYVGKVTVRYQINTTLPHPYNNRTLKIESKTADFVLEISPGVFALTQAKGEIFSSPGLLGRGNPNCWGARIALRHEKIQGKKWKYISTCDIFGKEIEEYKVLSGVREEIEAVFEPNWELPAEWCVK